MPCEILTEDVLQAVLRQKLSADKRALLLRHLHDPCEGCLDLLERWTAEEMLAPDDLLSRAEQERLFASAAPQTVPAERPVLKVMHLERRRFRLAWGAAAAVVAAGLVMMFRPAQRNARDDLKGVAAPAAALIPLVGARTPMPHVVRALPAGGQLAPGELLLLRIRLDAPAWVYLLSQKPGEAAELIWPLQVDARHEAGEFEVAESGSALAVDPGALGPAGRLLLVASPEPLDARRLQVREAARTREELEKALPGCSVDLLTVLVEGP